MTSAKHLAFAKTMFNRHIQDVNQQTQWFRGRHFYAVCEAESLVIACGGLALPQIGATPFGYKVAEQFGLAIVAPRPALVPLALAPETLNQRSTQ